MRPYLGQQNNTQLILVILHVSGIVNPIAKGRSGDWRPRISQEDMPFQLRKIVLSSHSTTRVMH